MSGFCHDPLGSATVYETVKDTRVGAVKLLIGVLYLVMMFITIGWVKMNERLARTTFHPDATNTVIFPPFVKILWLSALSNAFIGILMLVVPVEITGDDTHDNLNISVLLYPLAWALQHFVVEGVACMLMQKGCGVGAARTAFKQALLWAFVTFVLQSGVYSTSNHTTALAYQVAWSSLLLVFFLALWLTPSNHLFRRPACIPYAKFWFFFRVVTLLCFLASESNTKGWEEVGACGYVFLPLMGFPILQPLVCYWTLREDSLWWQGSFLSEFDDDDDSPLFGIDLTINTAIALAEVLDHISSSKSAKLINFAHIQTEWRLIGQGSFSKVYEGSYKHVPCALKLIFTTDLTAEDVNKATVEATLLSSIRSRNIINIYGICVNPPNVMIALELCKLGSLFDVLRNEHLNLSHSDRMFLGLGCCRGLDALHSLNNNIVHRDIKSMNFLVDAGLNAKLCDLELGQNESMSKKVMTENETEKFLLNWMPPEFIRFKQYTRASDVYALSLVLWEIVSGEVPFSNLSQQQIAHRVRDGLRPNIPECDASYCQLLTMGWAQEQDMRPTSDSMAAAMGSIWRGSFFRKHVVVETTADFSMELKSFLMSDTASPVVPNVTQQTDSHQGSGVKMTTFRTYRNPLLRGSLVGMTPDQQNDCSGLQRLLSVLKTEVDAGRDWDFGWAHFEYLGEPVLIITDCSPFLILNSSDPMSRLLGYSGKELQGMSLDCFVVSEADEVPGGGRALLTHLPKRSALLTSFYRTMLMPERSHLVLSLERADGQRIRCSVSSFPVHRFLCNPEQDSDDNAKSFEMFRDTVPDSDAFLSGVPPNKGGNPSPAHGEKYCGLLFSLLNA